MSILSAVSGTITGGIWKIAAAGLLCALVASSGYLGYEWHSAASARDTAITERTAAESKRDAAIAQVGQLQMAAADQNKAITSAASDTAVARAKYDTAMTLYAPISARLDTLSKKIASMPTSTTCAQSLQKQREAIDSLREVTP